MPLETQSRTRSSSNPRRRSRSYAHNGIPSPTRSYRTPTAGAHRQKVSSGGSIASGISHRSTSSQHRRYPQHHQKSRHSTPLSDVGSTASSVTSFVSMSREGREPTKTPRRGGSFREDSPPRRSQRGDTPGKDKFTSAKRAIEDLSKHLTDDKRGTKLAALCAEFDHWDEKKHNAELHFGAASVLSLALTMTNDDGEIGMICTALEMAFRASSESIHIAFDKVGSSVVPWMLQIMQKCENGKLRNSDACMLNVTKTFVYFSRVPELRLQLARHPRLSNALVRVSTSILSGECRVARMKLIANLVNCEDNKVYFLEHDGMLESILRIAALDLLDKPREYASLALMDLAACPSNHEIMAKNEKLLATLVKLAVIERAPETREGAVSALQNLAFCHKNRYRLVSFRTGVVVEALKKVISNDLDAKARRRASGALTNLACEETAEMMANHPGLLETLAVVSNKDDNLEVQARASMALTKIATSITCRMPAYKTLLDALVVASLSSTNNSVSAVLRVKARDPENRESMAKHPGVLDTLADICVSDAPLKERDNAMRAIMHLTNEESNHKVMCQKPILDALVTGASLEGKEWADIQESAVVAMERLATDYANRPIMAKHNGLLTAVARATEREDKGETNQSSRENLAKALLMSLLLAM